MNTVQIAHAAVDIAALISLAIYSKQQSNKIAQLQEDLHCVTVHCNSELTKLQKTIAILRSEVATLSSKERLATTTVTPEPTPYQESKEKLNQVRVDSTPRTKPIAKPAPAVKFSPEPVPEEYEEEEENEDEEVERALAQTANSSDNTPSIGVDLPSINDECD